MSRADARWEALPTRSCTPTPRIWPTDGEIASRPGETRDDRDLRECGRTERRRQAGHALREGRWPPGERATGGTRLLGLGTAGAPARRANGCCDPCSSWPPMRWRAPFAHARLRMATWTNTTPTLHLVGTPRADEQTTGWGDSGDSALFDAACRSRGCPGFGRRGRTSLSQKSSGSTPPGMHSRGTW